MDNLLNWRGLPWAAMHWLKKDDYHMESTTGYRISKAITANRWYYYAWDRGLPWETVKSRLKAHYGRGEHVPQARALLSVHKTLQQAKDACELAAQGEPA